MYYNYFESEKAILKRTKKKYIYIYIYIYTLHDRGFLVDLIFVNLK